MKKLFLFAVAITLSVLCVNAQNHPIETKNGYFYLNGKKFFMKGIGLETVRPGQKINSEETYNPDWFRFDVKRLLDAGYNTIRTWNYQTEEQLEAVKDLDMKILMGIWTPPHEDFSDPKFVKTSLDQVKKVLSYSKKYDNIIGYLIMNEPFSEDIMRNYSKTQELWKAIVDEIHKQHPNTPVGISAFQLNTYLDMELFDFAGFNSHPGYHPTDHCFDYKTHIGLHKSICGEDKPLLITEYGISVSPEADNSRFEGNTQEERQTNGLLSMYRALIDGGASGSFVFINADGWYSDGDENTHSNHVGEHAGLIRYESVTDHVGTPRPAWYALEKYQKALITSPVNAGVYQNKIPVEFFTDSTVSKFVIKNEETELLTSNIENRYYSGTIELTSSLQDLELDFIFYGQNNEIIKEETIICLSSDEKIEIPTLELSTDRDYVENSENITVQYELSDVGVFSVPNEIRYTSDPYIGYDWANIFMTEKYTEQKNYTFSKTYGTHFNSGVDIYSWNNHPILMFYGGTDISYGKFKKYIPGFHALWKKDVFVEIPAKIEAEDYFNKSGLYPEPTADIDGGWNMGYFYAGNWLEYLVDIPETGFYKTTIRYAAPEEGTKLSLKSGGVKYTFGLDSTGGWQNWENLQVYLFLKEGKHRLFFETSTGGLNLNWFELKKPQICTPKKALLQQVKVGPNPVCDGDLKIELPSELQTSGDLQISIIDISGRTFYQKSVIASQQNVIRINASDIPLRGSYVVRIKGSDFCVHKKIVFKQ